MKKNDLTLFQSILTGKHRPWRKNDHSIDKYKELLSTIQLDALHFQPQYELDFFPPHTPKCKYFHGLISNEANRYFNLLHDLINEAEEVEEKEYWTKLTLETKIPMLFKQIQKVIEERHFVLTDLDPEGANKLKNLAISEPAYTIFLLKTSLVWLFLEIQEIHKQNQNRKSESEVYLEFFSEAIPKCNLIKVAPEIVLPAKERKAVEPGESAFKPIKGEVPGTRELTVNYSFINNPEKFAEIESKLHQYGFIDSDSIFIKNKKESNNRNLAAILRVLIDCNYFRRNILGTTKKVKDTDIRKYIESRYSCDISQEFRKLQDEHIEAAKTKYYWIDRITPLR
jgi:hypothetical protein